MARGRRPKPRNRGGSSPGVEETYDEWKARTSSSSSSPSNPDGTAFEDKPKPDGSGKHDILFNRGTQDKDQHGHVAETRDPATGDRTYHYVRDNEGNVYIDDSKK